jgi:hypothetical protein
MIISKVQALGILNSLKMGINPSNTIGDLCVGRETHKLEIKRCLDLAKEGAGLIKFISGEYGSGKTFILNLVTEEAFNRNFVVSRLQIDGTMKFNDLGNFYYSLMHNLELRGDRSGGTSFEEIFDRWIEKLVLMKDRGEAALQINQVVESLNDYNSSFARAFLVYIKAKIGKDVELSNAAASWIKGEKNIPISLKAKFEVKGNVDKENSMDFFKAFLRLLKLIGYGGILITIDEIELLMGLRSDIRKTSYENLRYIIDTCGSEDFSNSMFCFAGTPEFFENEEKGVKSYKALAQRLGNAIDKKNSSLSDMRQTIMRLNELNSNDLLELTESILFLHKLAYTWEPDNSSSAIKSWTTLALKSSKGSIIVNTREFIVKLIEILDIMQQHPGYNIFNNELKIINNERGKLIQRPKASNDF